MTIHEIIATIQTRLAPGGRRVPEGARSTDVILPMVCADGLTLSVQASKFHYCTPRDSIGPWDAVEVGFPSEQIEALMPYAEDPDDPTGTVYGYVPLSVVAGVIAQHGGFAKDDPA